MKKKAKILAVDDSFTNNLLLEGILESEGYSIRTAYNASEALEEIDKEIPDLMLLDLMMPYVNGFKLLQKVKENKTTTNIPVIIISAKTDTNDIKKAFELGAIDYIKKPINIQALVDKIEFILENVL